MNTSNKLFNDVKDFISEGIKSEHSPLIIGAALGDYIFENYRYVAKADNNPGMEKFCVEVVSGVLAHAVKDLDVQATAITDMILLAYDFI